jgi:BRCT domain, a BRCA1 C-terminus domain
MVKPSKSMQPEQVDEDALQAGRKAVKTGSMRDGSNSFHNYMARKIAVQRQQFGLLLPPPPPPTLPSSTSIQNSCQLQLPASPGKSALLKRDASHVMEEGENETSSPVRNNKKQRAISFGVGTKPPAHSNGQKKRSALTSSKARSMLMRLGKRHGHVQEKQQRIQRLKRHNQDGHSKREDPVGQDGGGINKFSSGSDDVTKNFPKESKSTTEHSFVSCHGLAHKDDGNSDGPLTTTLTAPPSTTTLALQSDADDHDRLQLLTTRKAVPQKCTNVDVEPSTDATCQLDMDSPSTRKHFRPDLFFYGIVIKVQGFTDPDEHTLRRLIQKHGGDYETYETTRVTHIIASAMSTAKQNIYKNQRRPTPVCLPAWIVESAQTGELLPHGKYLLNKERSQQELHSMFEYSLKNQLKESATIKPPAKEHQTTNEQRTPALESPDSSRRHKHIAQSLGQDRQAIHQWKDQNSRNGS